MESTQKLVPMPGPGVQDFRLPMGRGPSPADWDIESDIGSTIDTASMSSNDHEEAIIRLVQESQVLRKVIQDTNDRLKTAEQNIERAEEKAKLAEEKAARFETEQKRVYDMYNRSEERAAKFEDRWKLTSMVLSVLALAAGMGGFFVGHISARP